jgi:hypothetical protein
MTKDAFEVLKKRYSNLLIVDGDVRDALEFVGDLLYAEANHIKATEPYATNSINRLNDAAYEVFNLMHDIENEFYS